MREPRPSWGGRLWTALLGLSIAAAGAATGVYLWMSYEKAARMDDWVQRPCRVISSELAEAGRDRVGVPRYRAAVTYEYEFGGENFRSDRIKRLEMVRTSKKALGKWTRRFPEGSEAACYVDPAEPSMAVLVKASKAALYTIWFPGLFVVGGLGIAAGAFRRR